MSLFEQKLLEAAMNASPLAATWLLAAAVASVWAWGWQQICRMENEDVTEDVTEGDK
jgi:hypothetical protein